jgi:hypothetical protein
MGMGTLCTTSCIAADVELRRHFWYIDFGNKRCLDGYILTMGAFSAV